MKHVLQLKKQILLPTASLSKDSILEIVSYLLTGGATTLINYMIYLSLLHFKADYLAANTAAWVFAVAFAYVSNRTFVFRSRNRVGKELFSFVSLRFLTLLMENALLILLVQYCQFHPAASKIAVSFVTVAANYVICKCQIFRKPSGCLHADSEKNHAAAGPQMFRKSPGYLLADSAKSHAAARPQMFRKSPGYLLADSTKSHAAAEPQMFQKEELQ